MISLELDFPTALDACCGPRMMWFDKSDPRALFIDRRRESFTINRGKPRGSERISVLPDIQASFAALPFLDATFNLVVFDPPHMLRSKVGYGGNSNLAKKYGVLEPGWQQELTAGFAECFRVLKPNGVLIFKWADTSVSVSQVLLAAAPQKPLFGSRRQKHTHWIVFLRPAA